MLMQWLPFSERTIVFVYRRVVARLDYDWLVLWFNPAQSEKYDILDSRQCHNGGAEVFIVSKNTLIRCVSHCL